MEKSKKKAVLSKKNMLVIKEIKGIIATKETDREKHQKISEIFMRMRDS